MAHLSARAEIPEKLEEIVFKLLNILDHFYEQPRSNSDEKHPATKRHGVPLFREPIFVSPGSADKQFDDQLDNHWRFDSQRAVAGPENGLLAWGISAKAAVGTARRFADRHLQRYTHLHFVSARSYSRLVIAWPGAGGQAPSRRRAQSKLSLSASND
jgi:hypothetical protein